ncbi:hypothetical protein TNCV_441341 [Trichonephila clavipes]|nr:hypothetical protein TNCV_441341 [Trichonephila clavipes]
MTFVQGVKSFLTCPCSLLASPAHLLDQCYISVRQLYEEQGLVQESSLLQAITKRVLFQLRSGASASLVHVVFRKFAEVEVLMREVG